MADNLHAIIITDKRVLEVLEGRKKFNYVWLQADDAWEWRRIDRVARTTITPSLPAFRCLAASTCNTARAGVFASAATTFLLSAKWIRVYTLRAVRTGWEPRGVHWVECSRQSWLRTLSPTAWIGCWRKLNPPGYPPAPDHKLWRARVFEVSGNEGLRRTLSLQPCKQSPVEIS